MDKKTFASTLTPIAGQSAPETIVRKVTESITTGEFRPGDKLPREEELARTFGVAPMTLRTALASLRELGLVVTTRGRFGGSYIAENVGQRLREVAGANTFTQSELRSLTDWRRAISGEACFLAAERGSERDIRRIEEAARRFDAEPTDVPARRMADAHLHTLIAEAAKSPDLLREEVEIQAQMNRLIMPLPLITPVKGTLSFEHRRLVSAIAARDADGARREMIAHVESTFEWCTPLLGC
ncbi:hypothetical protein CFB40_35255 [Burkholderia sp. AU31652]|nr:hypothetical protein CFB40_35255 [Burkholderia sp. AU31652]